MFALVSVEKVKKPKVIRRSTIGYPNEMTFCPGHILVETGGNGLKFNEGETLFEELRKRFGIQLSVNCIYIRLIRKQTEVGFEYKVVVKYLTEQCKGFNYYCSLLGESFFYEYADIIYQSINYYFKK